MCIWFVIALYAVQARANIFIDRFPYNYLEEDKYKYNETFKVNLAYSYGVSLGIDNLSVQINPFYKLNPWLKRLEIKGDFNLGDPDLDYNSQLVLVYNIVDYELLTLYLSYGIYGMYKFTVYDFDSGTGRDIKSFGNSLAVGVDIKIFPSSYIFSEYKIMRADFVNALDGEELKVQGVFVGLKVKLSLF